MARHRAVTPTSRMRRRSAALVLAVIGVAGLGLASAAQLNVGSGSLGAGTAVVASCQPANEPIRVQFTTAWQASQNRYRATGIALTGINAECNGLPYRITIRHTGGTLGDFTGTVVAGASQQHAITATAVSTIVDVSVVISS